MLAIALVLGCGSGSVAEPTYGTDASSDSSLLDATQLDARSDATPTDAAADAPSDAGSDAGADAGSATGCNDGCRLFPSYCAGSNLKACECYALRKNQVDPVCNGNVVTCLLNPCANKAAVCLDGGCAVQ